MFAPSCLICQNPSESLVPTYFPSPVAPDLDTPVTCTSNELAPLVFTFLSPVFTNFNPTKSVWPNLFNPLIPPFVNSPCVEIYSPSGITNAAALNNRFFYSSDNAE